MEVENKKHILRIIILLIAFFDAFSILFCRNMYVLTFLSLIQLIISIVFLYKYFKYEFFSLINIFLILSYIFHVGQYFLIIFNINADMPFNITIYGTNDEMLKSLQFYILCQSSMILGITLVNLFNKSQKIINCSMFKIKNSKTYFIISLILIFIGIGPKLYIDISKLLLYLDGNYLNTYNLNIHGFVSVMAHLFEYGLIMMLLYFSNNKKKSSYIVILGILMEIPIIISGNRGWAIIFVLLYIYLFINNVLKINYKRIKIRHIIISLLSIHIILSVVNFVSDYRSIEFHSISQVFNLYFPYLFKFSIFDTLGEFGGTMVSTIYSIRFIPHYSNYGFGLSYLIGFLNIFPNIGNFLGLLRNEMVFVYSFPTEYYVSLGGSYIGEMYYNFGYFSLVFSVILGGGIGYIFKLIKELKFNVNNCLTIICLCIFTNLLWWVRDYFSSMTREIIWISILIIGLNYIIDKFMEKKNGKN